MQFFQITIYKYPTITGGFRNITLLKMQSNTSNGPPTGGIAKYSVIDISNSSNSQYTKSYNDPIVASGFRNIKFIGNAIRDLERAHGYEKCVQKHEENTFWVLRVDMVIQLEEAV